MLSWTSWLSWWPFKPQTRVQSPPRVPNSNNWNCQNIEALILHSLLRGTTTIITITNKLLLGQPRGQVHVSRAVTESDEGASRTLDSERLLKIYASLAQLVEHLAVNQRVSGSSPEGGANIWVSSSAGWQQVAVNHQVKGSSPFSPSNMAYQFRRVERQPVTLEVTGSSPVCVATSLLSYLNTSYTYSYIKHLLSNTPSPFLVFMCSWYILRGRAAVAQRPHKPCVTGSNPVPATIICSCGRVGRLRQIANLLRASSPPKVRILPATPRPKVLLSTELVDCTQRGTFFLPKFR